MESTWWSALQILTSKCQACESNRTLLFKRWIHTTIHWVNYSTDSLRVTLVLSDKWKVWLICYYSKDLYSPSTCINQSWLPHLIILRSWKQQGQQGVWTIQRFILFFISCYKKLNYFIHEYYTIVDMSAGICWLTWLSCWLILSTISNEAWSTFALTVGQYVHIRVLLVHKIQEIYG